MLIVRLNRATESNDPDLYRVKPVRPQMVVEAGSYPLRRVRWSIEPVRAVNRASQAYAAVVVTAAVAVAAPTAAMSCTLIAVESEIIASVGWPPAAALPIVLETARVVVAVAAAAKDSVRFEPTAVGAAVGTGVVVA